MKIRECAPEMQNKLAFNRHENIGLSSIPGCYCITNIYCEILYIGKTVNLNTRMGQHLHDPRMRQRTNIGLASWFYYVEVPDRDLHVREEELLGRYIFKEGVLPPLNRQGP